MIYSLLTYVSGTILFWMVCELMHVDWQLMLCAIRDASQGTWCVPQLQFKTWSA